MSEKLINLYQVVLQTLLTVIVIIAAYNARSICKEQACIKKQLDKLKLNQVKILTILGTDPVAKTPDNALFDRVSGYHSNQ